MRTRQIKTKPDRAAKYHPAIIGGWLQGKSTYLWLGYADHNGAECFIGTVSKRKLYRLAKAIVRQFEQSK